MFRFLDRETPRVASLLFKRAQEAERRYIALDMIDLSARIMREFPKESNWISDSQVSFQYEDLPNFSFDILDMIDNRTLTILAGGPYHGFMLQRVSNSWHVSVRKPLGGPLGRRATRLANIFEEQFGVANFAKKIDKHFQR